jgi:hypothetical protein
MEEMMRIGRGITIMTITACLTGNTAKATEHVNADE